MYENQKETTFPHNDGATGGTDRGRKISRRRPAAVAARSHVWAGITTYEYQGESVKSLPAETIREDADLFANETDCSGLVLFRYALGDFPDVNDLWN